MKVLVNYVVKMFSLVFVKMNLCYLKIYLWQIGVKVLWKKLQILHKSEVQIEVAWIQKILLKIKWDLE